MHFVRNVLALVLFVATVVLLVARLKMSSDTVLTVWGDRDLWRALAVPEHWPLLGPESNGGIRAPGGAFYLILAAFLAVGRDVIAVNVAVVLLFVLSVLLLGLFFARKISPLAGALVACILASSVIVGETLGVWNPSLVLIFAVLATISGYAFLADGRPLHLGLATAALAIGMQVHLQITQIAFGLILATVVYRPRLTWHHAIALLLGLVVPYLPNILSGGFSLVETAASLPGNAIENYVFLDTAQLGQKAKMYANLFGGSTSNLINPSAFSWVSLSASDIVAEAVAVFAAIVFLRSPSKSFDGAPIGFFFLVLLVTAATALTSDLAARHMIAAAPAAAAFVGLIAERLVVDLGRQKPAAQVAAAILCGLFALRSSIIGVALFASPPFNMASVAAQKEIALTLKPAFYAERDAFEAHVAEFTLNASHSWLVVSNGIPNHLSFLYQTIHVANEMTNRKDCMAIVTKSDAAGRDPRSELAASPSLAGLGATFDAPLTQSEHFLYFPYITRDGNCLKTFPNGYIPTAFEADHLAEKGPAVAKVADDGVLFVVPQSGRRDPTGIEIRHEKSGYVAIFHGRLLRGYTGLYFRSIVSPVLCFVGEQEVRPIRFGNVTIGSPQRATLAPWRSSIFTLPDGRYRLWLIGSDGRLPIEVRDAVGDLVVPTMEAAVPLSATLEPPAECFGRNRTPSQR